MIGLKIEIDGGIGPHNTEEAVRAGVDIIVAGTAIFGADDPAASFREMKAIAERTAGKS